MNGLRSTDSSACGTLNQIYNPSLRVKQNKERGFETNSKHLRVWELHLLETFLKQLYELCKNVTDVLHDPLV